MLLYFFFIGLEKDLGVFVFSFLRMYTRHGLVSNINAFADTTFIIWSTISISAVWIVQYFSGSDMTTLVRLFNNKLIQTPGTIFTYCFSIMNGEESLSNYSPEIVAKESSAQNIALLPPIFLMHGTADYSIPSSSRFVHMLSWDVYLRQWRANRTHLPSEISWYCGKRSCPSPFALQFTENKLPLTS